MEAIHLDPKWRIEKDAHSFKLVFSEQRTKKKFDKNKEPTGEVEDYLHEEPWYFPTISMCLKKYLNEATKADESVKALDDRLNRLEKKIEDLKITFKR